MVEKKRTEQQVEARRARNQRRREARRSKIQALGLGELVDLGPNQTRSGLSPNPSDPRSGHVLNALGSTVNGRRACVKMLHPCGEHDTFVTKIPDGAATASVVLERRDEYDLNTQFGGSTGSWYCLVIHTPFLLRSRMAIQWLANTSPSQTTLQAVFNHWCCSVNSATDPVYPNWGTETAGGIVFWVTWMESATVTPTVLTSGADSLFRDIRRTAYGSTVDFDAASLTDNGRVVVGQWSADITLATENEVGTIGTGIGLISESDVYRGILPPLTSTEMVSNDLKVYQNKAKCGSYMPLRNWQTDFVFTSAHERRYVDLSSTGGTVQPSVATPTQDIWLRGWGIGVELYINMDETTNLRCKLREDLELVTTTSSPYAPFSTEGFSEDRVALALVKEFGRIEPHGYPSDFNSLNEMLKNIIGGIGSAVGNLGIPVLSNLAPHLAKLVTGLF